MKPRKTRRQALRALAGLLASVATPAGRSQGLGKVPGRLAAGRSVYESMGECRINGKPVSPGGLIAAGDTITTGRSARLIFVVGTDAFVLRENSRVELRGKELVLDGLRLATGALLSVFGGGTREVDTAMVTIGTRGTGLYVDGMGRTANGADLGQYGDTNAANQQWTIVAAP